MAGTDTITIYRGEDVSLSFTMNPVEDISGWSITFTVEASGSKIIQESATVDDGPSGQFSIDLADTDTNQRVGTYQYDVWRTDDGLERCIALGNFVIVDVARYPA